jgi:hypothetical protein
MHGHIAASTGAHDQARTTAARLLLLLCIGCRCGRPAAGGGASGDAPPAIADYLADLGLAEALPGLRAAGYGSLAELAAAAPSAGDLKEAGLDMRARKALLKALKALPAQACAGPARPAAAAPTSSDLSTAPPAQAAEEKVEEEHEEAERLFAPWSPDSAVWERLETPRCTVERVGASALTPNRFLSEYNGVKPVIITGLTANWSAHERWSRDALLARFGGRTVGTRGASKADFSRTNAGRGGTATATLAEYVASFEDAVVPATGPPATGVPHQVTYSFDPGFLKQLPELEADFEVPPHFAKSSVGGSHKRFLFLGGAGSGLGFHGHGASWNALVLGRKRWFIYPPHWFHPALKLDPARDDYDLDGLSWFKNAYPAVEGTALAPTECVTAAGDVLYLPEHWMHATLNTAANVGVAVTHLPGASERSANSVRQAAALADFHFEVDPPQSLAELEAAARQPAADCAAGGGVVAAGFFSEARPAAQCVRLGALVGVAEVSDYVMGVRNGFRPLAGAGATREETRTAALTRVRAGLARLDAVLRWHGALGGGGGEAAAAAAAEQARSRL